MLARRPQRAIRSLDCFLPEGAGSREEKKGAGRGSRVWFLPPPRFLSWPVCQGTGGGGGATLALAKARVFSGPQNQGTLE